MAKVHVFDCNVILYQSEHGIVSAKICLERFHKNNYVIQVNNCHYSFNGSKMSSVALRNVAGPLHTPNGMRKNS